MRVYTDGGYTNYANIAILNPFFMQIYVKPSSMAKNLPLGEVTSSYDVIMNNEFDPSMHVYVYAFKKIVNFRLESTNFMLTTSMPISLPIPTPKPTIVPAYLQINIPVFNKLVPVRLTTFF